MVTAFMIGAAALTRATGKEAMTERRFVLVWTKVAIVLGLVLVWTYSSGELNLSLCIMFI